jgi:hypothetical protein
MEGNINVEYILKGSGDGVQHTMSLKQDQIERQVYSIRI